MNNWGKSTRATVCRKVYVAVWQNRIPVKYMGGKKKQAIRMQR